jgi:hypothetical protein
MRGEHSALTVAGVFARNLIPVAGMLWFGWSATKFVLLIVFNFGLSLALISAASMLASTLRTLVRPSLGAYVGNGIVLALSVAFVSGLITVMLGWPIYLQSPDLALDRGWWWSLLATVVTALPAFFADVRKKMPLVLSDEEMEKRDRPRIMLCVVSIIPIAAMWGTIGDAHPIGTAIVVGLFTAFAIVRDLRPDLADVLAKPAR